MAFERLKKLFNVKPETKTSLPVRYSEEPQEREEDRRPARREKAPARPVKRAARKAVKGMKRKSASPYINKPSLEKENIAIMERVLQKTPEKYRTDKHTLMEIADLILQKEIGMPRPPGLRAHDMFAMFIRKSGRIRSGVSTACHEWRGSYKGGAPVLTTLNSIHGHRLLVDARKYVLENPPKGKRRNFRTKPENICGNPQCVNPKHVEMRGLDPEMRRGENHGRAKYSDKEIKRWVREYNAGATAKELAKKYKVIFTYIEQIMRKEKRTEATEGMTIRGRFGSR